MYTAIDGILPTETTGNGVFLDSVFALSLFACPEWTTPRDVPSQAQPYQESCRVVAETDIGSAAALNHSRQSSRPT